MNGFKSCEGNSLRYSLAIFGFRHKFLLKPYLGLLPVLAYDYLKIQGNRIKLFRLNFYLSYAKTVRASRLQKLC